MTTRSQLLRAAGLLVVVGASACGGSTEPACTGVAVAGLSIDVVEAGSGVRLRRDVTIRATGAGFDDSRTFTEVASAEPWTTAHDRAGTYTVTVRRPGYEDWTRSNVVVEQQDRCHVRTTSLTAELEPANRAQFTFSGVVSGTFEARGVPRLPNDYSRDFAALAFGQVNGTAVPHQLLAVNAGSSYASGGVDDFVFWLNPSITQPGTYSAASCPTPSDFGGCAHASMNLGRPPNGNPTLSLFAIANSTSVTVQEITPDRLRATFQGAYILSGGGQALGEVVVSGTIDVTRTFAP